MRIDESGEELEGYCVEEVREIADGEMFGVFFPKKVDYEIALNDWLEEAFPQASIPPDLIDFENGELKIILVRKGYVVFVVGAEFSSAVGRCTLDIGETAVG